MKMIYLRWILLGRITLEDVPLKWRDDVAQELEQEENEDGSGAVD